jgi:hypothetical protein
MIFYIFFVAGSQAAISKGKNKNKKLKACRLQGLQN